MPRFSVRKPLTVFVAVVAIIVLGIVSFTSMTPNLLPNLDLPYVIIVTTYPGATPEEVESEVTKPIEQSMAVLDNISQITSTSSENYSMVLLEFNSDANMDTISLDISQGLDQITGSWGDMIGSPYTLKLNPDMVPVIIAAADVSGMDTMELSAFIEDTLMTDLEGINGVASVELSGNIQQTANVLFNQEKIDALNDKIAASINSSFTQAEGELNDAINELEGQQSELESGKSQIADGQNTLGDQSSAAGSTITAKQVELSQAKLQLTAQITEFNTQLSELYDSRAQLMETQGKITELETAVSSLSSSIEALQTIKDALDSLDAANREFAGQIEQINSDSSLTAAQKAQMLEAIYSSDAYKQVFAEYAVIDAQLTARGLDRSSVPQTIAAAQISLDQVISALSSIDSALVSMGISRSDMTASIAEIDFGIAQLETGISALNDTLSGIESGTVQLSDAQAELEKQKIAAIFQLSDASTQLLLGNATLTTYLAQANDGLQQIQDSKEEAYRNADLSNVITLDTVSSILSAQNFSMPAGYVEQDGVKYLVSVGDAITSIQEMGDLLLFDLNMEGVEPIYLLDVADVFMADNSAQVYAKINGNNGVLISFSKQSTYSTADSSNNIHDQFALLSEKYDGLSFTVLMDQGEYINIIIKSIMQSLLLGALFAVIILFLFLRDIRPTFITLVSIPVSILLALALMYFSGVSINMFSLSGLAVAVGMLVDNSIVVIENTYRLRKLGESPIKSAISGASQVAGAVISSTLTTVCVFLPIVFVEGLTKQLFTDFALTFAYALLASLVISLTLVPAMASGMLRTVREGKNRGIFDSVMVQYRRSLTWALGHRAIFLSAAAVLLVASALMTLSRGFSFMPSMEMEQLSATLEMPADASLEDTIAMSDEIITMLNEIDGISTVGAMLSSGTSMMSLGSSDSTNSVDMYILLDESSKRGNSEITADIENKTKNLDCDFAVSSASAMDISALTGSGVSINIYSSDLDRLQEAAADIAEILRTVDGVAEVSDGLEDSDPTIKVTVDKNKAMAQGLTVAQIYAELSSAITVERTATSITYDGNDYEVHVNSGEAGAKTPDFIRNYVLKITDNQGNKKDVALSDIAAIEDSESLSSISRIDQQRYLVVTGEVAEDRNVTHVSSAAQSMLASYKPPTGVTFEISGESTTIMDSIYEVAKMLSLGVLLVYLVMVAQFQSLKSPFIVMFTIPLAFTGSFLALFITGMDVSVIALIGFVMLVGIIVNNGIVLVDYINQLRAEGQPIAAAIKDAGVTRMRPVLMTSLTTICGLIFTAIGTGSGAEMMQPIAIVCIGGLIYATIMTLYVVPVLYSLLNRKEMRTIGADELLGSEK